MSFGAYLKQAIEKRGCSYRQLSILADIDHTYISKIVNGKMGPPSPEILKKLSKPLGVSYEELMEKAGYINLPNRPDANSSQTFTASRMAKVPVLGNITADKPLYSEQHICGYQYIAEDDAKYGEYFYLRVTSDSMTGSRIHPGDLVYVRKQKNIENGDIVLLLSGNEVSLKRVFRAEGKIILQPDNPKYEPVIVDDDDIKVLGKVIHVRFDV